MVKVDSSWSDDQIISYLKQLWGCDDFVFDCKVSDTPIFTPTPENYKGSISNITYNGKQLSYPNSNKPIFVNIPKTVIQDLPAGKCKLRFVLLRREARLKSNNPFVIIPDYGSFRELNIDKARKIQQQRAETGKVEYSEREKDLFERWGVKDCKFIGKYTYDAKQASYTVSDIRKPNFARMSYYPNDKTKSPIVIKCPAIKDIEKNELPLNEYYLFNWKFSDRNPLNRYEIQIDFSIPPQPIRPHWFIDQLFYDRYNDVSKNFDTATNFLDTLSKQLSAKDSTFIYELLQNADDYPEEEEPVDVEFHITDHYLIFLHSGAKFNIRNISGICGVNEKEKTANKKTIGYKGIGFKTVFHQNHYVYIQTGDYSFRFEEKADVIKRQEAPWPILPIWTALKDVPAEVAEIFKNADPKFRVKIALRPDDSAILHEGRLNYEALFSDLFADSNLILFTQHIRSVKVYIHNQVQRDCFIDESRWVVNDYEEAIDEELQKYINKDIETGRSRIPEKYKDFEATKVSFACRKEGRKLLPIEDAILYCYLPTSTSWGFPFLLNTDMIPKGDRNDIEREVFLRDENETNFNFELARIAGKKFFSWIQELVFSEQYDYESIFALIPDFDKCIREHRDYEEFITNFRDGFNELLQSEPIVPVIEDNKTVFKPIELVIYDTTGLSCSGMMTDEEILKLCQWRDYFPHPTLRDYSNASLKPAIDEFLATYHSEDQEFDVKNLVNCVKYDEFKEWLRNQDNNNKFLILLVNKGLIGEFQYSLIFLNNDLLLRTPSTLYYDIDAYYDDISYLEPYLDRLSNVTKTLFEGNTIWDKFSFVFLNFEPNNFVNNVLLAGSNFAKVHSLLSAPEAAFKFMLFLAKYVDYKSSFRKFPFVDEDGSIVDSCDSRDFTYLPGEQIIELRNQPWVDSEQIAIFSSHYDDLSIDYIKENFGDMECTTQSFIEQYICSGKYADNINDLIDEWEVNKDFVNFLFAHQEFIPDGKLEPYKVGCYNKSGIEDFGIITENYLYLLDPKADIHFESLPWVDDDMLDVVREDYFTDTNRQKQTLFFEKKFNIPVLNLDSYINEILERLTSEINSYLKDEQTNFAFWRWTKEHYEEREKLDPVFEKFYVLAKTLDEELPDYYIIEDYNLFLSSAYQQSDDVEKIVSKYAPKTLFIASYMEKASDKVKAWVNFWCKVGVKTTIEELIFNKIIPNLEEIQEDGLPNLLGDYHSQIKEHWDDVKDALCKIRVKTRRDGFYNIHDAVVINVNKDKEPFKDIIISNEIDPAIIGNKNTRELLLDIAEYANAWMVNNMTDWQQYKVSAYAVHEDEYSEEIHMDFIKELALIDVETIKSFKHIDCLQLLGRDGIYVSPSLLTLGSLYKPECDFEKFDVDCRYISDKYYAAEAAEALNMLIKKEILDVHHSFTSGDIDSLSSYDFALYFWKDYAWAYSSEISEWIEDDLFDGVKCVPTMAKTVDSPNNLYSRDISEYVVKGINKWESKLPSDQIPQPKEGSFDMFATLPFKDHLSFNDALEALINIKNVGKRATILTWLHDEYSEDKADLITAYRNDKDALWKNGKGKEVPLTELYALAPESTMLFDYFQDNEYVFPYGYLHDLTEDDYRGICSMMQLPLIEEEDMEFTPFDSVKENLGHYFEGKLLIFAAIDNPKNWAKAFANYKEKLSELTFWKCSKIAWVYGKNEAVQQSNRKFFCQDNRFFYVGTWSGFQVSRFFLDSLEEHIGLTLHRNEELFLRIMDPAAEMQELLEDYHSIKTEEFIAELNKYSSYQPEVLSGKDDGDEDDSPNYRPRTFDPELQHKQTSPDYDNPYEDEDIEPQYEDVDTSTDSPRSAREANPIRTKERRRPEHIEHPRVQPKQVEEAHDGTYSGSDAPEEKNPISNTPRRPHAPAEPGERRASSGSSHASREPYSPNPDAIKSEGIPVELATLEMGAAEEADLRRILNGMSSDAIANNAYLANYRLYKQIENWKNEHPEYDIEPEESEADFIRNIPKEGGVISDHRLKSGKFMRACSAAGGVLYLSPGIWNMVADNRCMLCIYRGADNNRVANEFLLIKSYDELLEFIGHDDLIVKITGEHRVQIVEFLYNNLNSKVTRGTVYSLIRVSESTSIDNVAAPVSTAMTEQEDEDSKFF